VFKPTDLIIYQRSLPRQLLLGSFDLAVGTALGERTDGLAEGRAGSRGVLFVLVKL
jgi:hypothetical protein